MPGGPIFIVGAMGSGTTLLRLMLDSHEHIAIPHETGFMRAYNAHRFAPFKHSGRDWAQRLGWTDEEFDEVMRDLYDRLFMRYAERHGKRRWGEKTPLHTWHIESMARVFPDAQLVAVVRHPFGSVASNTERFPAAMPKHARHWERYNRELAAQMLRHPGRMVLLRYEDLVLRPEPVLRELLDWLGEPWSDAVLAHHEIQPGRGGRLQVEGRSRVDDPIDTSRVDKWTRTLDDEARRFLEKRLGRLGAFYGYSSDDAVALGELSRGGSLLARAEDLRARMADYEDLALGEPVRPAPHERFYNPRRLALVPKRKAEKLRTPAEGAAVSLIERLTPRARRRLGRLVRRAR